MTPEKEKKLFAAYLNMARQNAFITLSHITKLTGGKIGSEESLNQMVPIQQLAKKEALPETIAKIMKLLDEHFPFLKPMLDQDKKQEKKRQQRELTDKSNPFVPLSTPEMYHKILYNVFRELNSQRNQYTHVRHKAEPFDKALIQYMKNCFDGAVRVAKERFNLPDRNVKHLFRSNEKPEIVYDKNGSTKRIYKEKPISQYKYKFDDDKGEITTTGLAFFTCLFLEKKYANMLLSQIHGFKRSGQKEVDEGARATKTVFSIYNIRIPKLRIDSESSAMALGIDMLNEIKKCPAELFEHLDADNQKSFRIVLDESQPDDDLENTVLLRRFENRFPQLALSYIDQQKLFFNVHFQVALGTYRYKFYDKQGVDQKERVRIIQKKLHGFGRLQEIEERRRLEWKDKIRSYEDIEQDHAGTYPYITDTHAQYMVSNNRVGMYWNNTDDGYHLPTLKEDGAKNQAPVCWLSIYELPALIFHSLLCSKQYATQYIVCDYVRQYGKLFSDIRAGDLLPSPDVIQAVKKNYNINFSQLPDEIRDYLSGKTKDIERKFVELAEARILRMIKNTQGRGHRIKNDIATIRDNKINKVGKKRYVEIKSGILADFLTKDLLLFQPTQTAGKDKLTGANYQALQASLAYYGAHKTNMKQILTACKLLDSPVAHPFLYQVIKKPHDDIVSFYQSYLDEREKYLNKCLQEKDYKQYHFLHANRDKWQSRSPEYYKQLAGKYLDLPIELPRGLFKEAIQKLLAAHPEMKEALAQKRCNTVYLIKTYFNTVRKDGRQVFYDFPRGYKLFDTLDDKIVRNKLQQAFHTTAGFEKRLENIDVEIEKYIEKQYQQERKRLQEKRFFRDMKKLEEEKNTKASQIRTKLTHLQNEFEKNEKILRLTQVQDMLLFLMAKRLLIDSQSHELREATIEEYKLTNINSDSEKGILSAPTPFSLPVNLKDGTSKTIRQEALKLKKFGDFYRLVRDRRMETLLPHLPDETIDRLTLEKELERYDSVRVEIFELIHRFECQVIEKKNIQTSSPDFVELLRWCPEIDRETKQQMQIIRNAFSHNSYPKETEHIRDVESSDAKTNIDVYFRLDGAMPNVAVDLKGRLEKLIEDSLINLQ